MSALKTNLCCAFTPLFDKAYSQLFDSHSGTAMCCSSCCRCFEHVLFPSTRSTTCCWHDHQHCRDDGIRIIIDDRSRRHDVKERSLRGGQLRRIFDEKPGIHRRHRLHDHVPLFSAPGFANHSVHVKNLMMSAFLHHRDTERRKPRVFY